MSKTATKHLVLGLLIRLTLVFILPTLMDDGLLLQGVRYTDVDYDVFTDAANHIAEGRSPYRRHTYRYTPFLAALLSLPIGRKTSSLSSAAALIFSTKYFGKILFCVADALCGYIILVLRVRSRRNNNQRQRINGGKHLLNINLSQEFIDALWWLYNPLPINICTRGSAEALVVLLPVLLTVALTVEMEEHETSPQTTVVSIRLRACLAGVLHGIGVHCKLYPVIYTLSFMANFSFQEQRQRRKTSPNKHQQQCWTHLLSEQTVYFRNCMCCGLQQPSGGGFPWKHPMKIFILGLLWMQRLFLTMSSILFLACSIGTVVLTTYSAVYFYGLEALEEGLLYHFGRIDHRHNYSMYWYWIYLLRGRMADSQEVVALLTWIGNIPLIPQVLILGFSSVGIAPYDLTFALFCQTFSFVAFNKVTTAQYFTWYLALLPLCADRIQWSSRRILLSLSLLMASILTWLGSAFTLEMLGWRSHRQVWMASLLFFIANLNILVAILNGYRVKKISRSSSEPGEGWAVKPKKS